MTDIAIWSLNYHNFITMVKELHKVYKNVNLFWN